MTADHPRVILQVADVVDGFASTPRPRLTWRTETETADWVQAKATIEIERDGKSETAIVEGEGSVLVEWPFAPIRPRENVAVKVHVTGTNDAAGGGWSDAVDVIGGTLDEWTARFVRSDTPRGRGGRPLVRMVHGRCGSACPVGVALGGSPVSLVLPAVAVALAFLAWR